MLISISILSVAICLAVILWPRPSIRQPVRRFEIPLKGSEVLFGNAGAISPNGAAVAYVMDGALWVRTMDAIEARKIADEASSHAAVLVT